MLSASQWKEIKVKAKKRTREQLDSENEALRNTNKDLANNLQHLNGVINTLVGECEKHKQAVRTIEMVVTQIAQLSRSGVSTVQGIGAK